MIDQNKIIYCAILCLAMWGSNCRSYIDEVNRILDYGGTLLIIEPARRWINEEENKLEKLLIDKGFVIKNTNIELILKGEDKFIFVEAKR